MSKSNYTVLIIDYEPRNIETVRTLMEKQGCHVEVAQDGVSGLQAFARLKPDLVLIEAMLPKKHGFEVCQDIKRSSHGKGTPVIITTAVYRGRKYRTQALHIYGCDEYLEKPIEEDKLLATCTEVLGRVGKSFDKQAAPPAKSNTASGSKKKKMRKKGEIPTAVVNDLTEEEIMARLEALMPGEESPDESVAAAPAAHVSDASTGGEVESPGGTVQTPHAGETSEADALQTGHVIHQVDGATAPDPAYEPESARDEIVDEIVEEPKTSSQVVPFEDKRGRRAKDAEEGDGATAAPADLESELEEITSVLANSVPDQDEIVPPAPDVIAPVTTIDEDDSEVTAEAEAFDSPADEDDAEEEVDVDVAVADILDEHVDESETTDSPEAVDEPDTPAAIAASAIEDADEYAGTETIAEAERTKGGSRSTMIWIVIAIVVVVGAAAGAYFFMTYGTESLPGFGSSAEETSRPESTSRAASRPAAVLPPVTRPATTPEIDPVLNGETGTTEVEKPPSSTRASSVPVEKTQTPKPQPTRPTATETAPAAAASKPKPAVTRTPEPAKTEPAPPGPAAKTESAAAAVARDTKPEPVAASTAGTKVAEPPATPAAGEPEPVVEESPAAEEEGELVAMSSPILSDPPRLPEPATPPAPKKTSPGDLIEIQNLDTPPVAAKRVAPVYPPLARRVRHDGTAIFNVLIDEKGRVAEIEVIKGVGREDMDAAALDAVRQWTFKPATKDGVPVKVWKIERVAFKL